MLLRHRSRRPVLVSFQQQSGDSRASDDFGQDLSDMYQQLSTEAEQLERRELLELAFDRVRVRVNAATWQAFELMTLGGYAAEEATRILGVSRATVYLSNARVRTLLLEELSGLDWV
jgi:DNA-directed RNA polymerase specialized sigma24 family protein